MSRTRDSDSDSERDRLANAWRDRKRNRDARWESWFRSRRPEAAPANQRPPCSSHSPTLRVQRRA
jgi:hypothetical protein